MNRMCDKQLSKLAAMQSEIRHCGEFLIALSDWLAGMPRGNMKSEQAETTKEIKLEEVRAVLAEKSRSGHTAEVRRLLLKHGADRLSAIAPAEYATLLADAKEL